MFHGRDVFRLSTVQAAPDCSSPTNERVGRARDVYRKNAVRNAPSLVSALYSPSPQLSTSSIRPPRAKVTPEKIEADERFCVPGRSERCSRSDGDCRNFTEAASLFIYAGIIFGAVSKQTTLVTQNALFPSFSALYNDEVRAGGTGTLQQRGDTHDNALT